MERRLSSVGFFSTLTSVITAHAGRCLRQGFWRGRIVLCAKATRTLGERVLFSYLHGGRCPVAIEQLVERFVPRSFIQHRAAADEPAHRGLVSEPVGAVHALVAGEPAEHRLPE